MLPRACAVRVCPMESLANQAFSKSMALPSKLRFCWNLYKWLIQVYSLFDVSVWVSRPLAICSILLLLRQCQSGVGDGIKQPLCWNCRSWPKTTQVAQWNYNSVYVKVPLVRSTPAWGASAIQVLERVCDFFCWGVRGSVATVESECIKSAFCLSCQANARDSLNPSTRTRIRILFGDRQRPMENPFNGKPVRCLALGIALVHSQRMWFLATS